MKKIKLTQGKFALVSDIDYAYLNQWKWYAAKQGNILYAFRTSRLCDNTRKTIRMHRVILGRKLGHNNFRDTDHIDHDGLHNWRRNLRPSSHNENMCHQRKHQNNKSGFKGVYWDRERKKWKVQIANGGSRKYIGRFGSILKAAKAYNMAAKKYHSKFAVLNPV